MTAAVVAEGAKKLASEVVAAAFSTEPDEITFRPGAVPTGELNGDLLRTVESFIAGVGAMRRFGEIQQAMLSLEQRLLLRPNPSVPLEHLALKPLHGFVPSRLDGSLTFQEITRPPRDGRGGGGNSSRASAARIRCLRPASGPGLFRTDLLLADHQRHAMRGAAMEFNRETYSAIQSQNPTIPGITGDRKAGRGQRTASGVRRCERSVPRACATAWARAGFIEARRPRLCSPCNPAELAFRRRKSRRTTTSTSSR